MCERERGGEGRGREREGEKERGREEENVDLSTSAVPTEARRGRLKFLAVASCLMWVLDFELGSSERALEFLIALLISSSISDFIYDYNTA